MCQKARKPESTLEGVTRCVTFLFRRCPFYSNPAQSVFCRHRFVYVGIVASAVPPERSSSVVQFTTCTSIGDVLPVMFAVPAYTVAMLWEPLLRLDVL